MTVLEVIQRSNEFLARNGVESPRLQVELMLASVLGLPRLKLYLNFERVLTDEELGRIREMVRRRGEREPLQHIIGTTCFCGLEFIVNRDVLIPRPETELLAERAWEYLSSLAEGPSLPLPLGEGRGEGEGTVRPDKRQSPQPHVHGERATPLPLILDVGTGSGCLAVTLAVKCPAARLHATDSSAAALAVARANAQRHGVSERIEFHEGDLFADLPAEAQFHLIVTNPPYIATTTIETLEPEVRDHDPRAALDGGPDGLQFYRRLATHAGRYLAPNATLMAEFGDGQEQSVAAIFTELHWIVEEIVSDLSQKPRIVIARGPV